MKILITGGSGFIGTNFIEHLLLRGKVEFVNIDLVKPKLKSHNPYWFEGDVRDAKSLCLVYEKVQPGIVVHLAARTDLNGTSLEDYSSNTLGTKVLLDVLNHKGFSGKAIFTSSMYVCEPGYTPINFDDYNPHTIYGESKVESEKIIKTAKKNYTSTIIRPTSIWGPWFSEPYSDFFNLVLSRKYFNLSKGACKKTYGYIGNTVQQISSIINADSAQIDNRVFYLGDWPEYPIDEWAHELAATVPYKIISLPYWFFKLIAIFGDSIKTLGFRFPMTSFRLRNMTTDNVHDLSAIRELLNELPFDRVQGISHTIEWIKSQKK